MCAGYCPSSAQTVLVNDVSQTLGLRTKCTQQWSAQVEEKEKLLFSQAWISGKDRQVAAQVEENVWNSSAQHDVKGNTEGPGGNIWGHLADGEAGLQSSPEMHK